jgi:transcriptional regulator with XRE-family HTH domain
VEPDNDRHLLDAVGRRIAELRKRAGLTQAQMAEGLGTTVSNYQRIEHGFQNLTIVTMVKISRILGVKIGALFAAPHRSSRQRGRPPKSRGRSPRK